MWEGSNDQKTPILKLEGVFFLNDFMNKKVIQRRQDGTVNFYRKWVDYKRGFGSAAGEYWLGMTGIP